MKTHTAYGATCIECIKERLPPTLASHVLDIVMLGYAVIAVLTASLFLRVLNNYSRLRSIPGPVSAGVSGLWQQYAQRSPVYDRNLGELHQQYGRVVRIEPNAVSLSDPGAILQMYDRNIRLKKVFGTVTITASNALLGSSTQSAQYRHAAFVRQKQLIFRTGLRTVMQDT